MQVPAVQDPKMTVLELRQTKCRVEVMEGGEVVHMLQSKYLV